MKKDDSANLLRAIEVLREQMHKYELGGDSSNKELLRISQELDELLNRYERIVLKKEKANT